MKKYVLQNIELMLLSLCLVAIDILLGWNAPSHFTTILKGFTGGITFFALAYVMIWYIVKSSEELLLRILTIPMLTLLTTGYFLYLIFHLEAYKFTCSALIFDGGTFLVPVNLGVRLWRLLSAKKNQ